MTAAWHLPKSDVYHDHPDCEIGAEMPTHLIRKGTGGRRKCPRCAALEARDSERPPPETTIPEWR